MKNNKGITLTSLIVYIAVIFVVIATLMRITTHYSGNMTDVADVSFETEFQKINLYLLDETKKTENYIISITEDRQKITFAKGNIYTYNAEEKTIYLNDTIKVCEGVESCLFEEKTADNGKNVLSLTIKINGTEKNADYVMITKKIARNLLPDEYQQLEYIKSTGTQYINTGYYPDLNTNAKYKVSISAYTTYGPHLLSSNNYVFPFFRGDAIHLLAKRGDRLFSDAIIEAAIDTIYEFEAYWNGKIIINGEEIGELLNTGETDTTPLYLGAYGGDLSNQTYFLNGNIYYCRIYNGETLVRDFIPCYRKLDNVVGMYDLVNNLFYTNQGTGEFIKGEECKAIIAIEKDNYIKEEDYTITMQEEIKSDLLPGEYQQVEYIESTGTQYINTEYLPNGNTNAKYKFSLLSYGEYGPHLLSSKTYIFPFLRGQYNHIMSKRGGDTFFSTELEPVVGTIYDIQAFWSDRIIINGRERGVLTNTGEGDTTSLYIGTYGGDPSNQEYTLNGKIYYCKIYNGKTLERDFSPCYRKSDNVAGLYDLVNNKFYTNAGTGEFIVGPKVD